MGSSTFILLNFFLSTKINLKNKNIIVKANIEQKIKNILFIIKKSLKFIITPKATKKITTPKSRYLRIKSILNLPICMKIIAKRLKNER